ncbi:YidC/Oxa1 family membrane protein insertase [Lentibacillus halodurans]|uniref:Membrane protein insertase YidC n=1 Tax=Lentibacillus halodurans TaxID=237679 RepID=A0A1I0ZSZ1_9BACI|nr:membrane protein insertase YidC [Lentibacillus halodurans]SFB28889.1 YidC/Oxa1 family membrane protein insertase [Lentibacillus halodurans]
MEQKSVFTFLGKYSLIAVTLLIFLTGCAADGGTFGLSDHYLIDPFSYFIKNMASLFGDNYGLSIIVMTFIIRITLMPFMLKQMKGSRDMQEKMKLLKPEMDKLKEKYKNSNNKDANMQMQQEMMQLYQKHQINPMSSIGCLPMIIQFPILIGFYYAIRRTPEIASHSFLWFNLGDADILMALIAMAVYFIQFKVSQIGMDPNQKKQMAVMGLISPIMIGVVSFGAPAALPLYWAAGGLFLIVQTIIAKKLFNAHNALSNS